VNGERPGCVSYRERPLLTLLDVIIIAASTQSPHMAEHHATVPACG
jgi:hypothetical protein